MVDYSRVIGPDEITFFDGEGYGFYLIDFRGVNYEFSFDTKEWINSEEHKEIENIFEVIGNIYENPKLLEK